MRCAIYTRKSSSEGLDQQFNSLDAQRLACSHYVASQASGNWIEPDARYDDGGCSGGTLARPALQRLLEDVESGAVGTVVVYKIDRLSRSLRDFVRLMEVFERHGVTFVSVTQHFSTTSSMGRLTLKAEKWRIPALENLQACARRAGCWVMSSDIVGTNWNGWLSFGCTAIVGPDGTIVARADESVEGDVMWDLPSG